MTSLSGDMIQNILVCSFRVNGLSIGDRMCMERDKDDG